MHWSEFQDTAERLASGATEGDWRSAISRSYYAVYHYFREFLLSHGVNVGSAGQSHSNLYIRLLHCGFGQVADVVRRIDDLRYDRGQATYDLGWRVDQALAQDRVQEARAVVTDFQALLATLPAASIASGVRNHLQAVGRLRPTP